MRLLTAAVLVLVAALSLGQTGYARRALPIKAGILVVQSQRTTPPDYATNYAPHVLFNLDSNRRVMPPHIFLDNPAHPSTLTNENAARWSAIAGFAPAAGTRLEKRHAAYWEVMLDSISEAQLSQFDVLLLPAYDYLSLTTIEREKLRRFMDRGGVLWVDLDPSTLVESINNLPAPFVVTPAIGGGGLFADYFNPVLAYPIAMGSADLLLMQSTGGAGIDEVDLTALGYGNHEESQQWLGAEFVRLVAVAEDAAGEILSVAKMGDGFQVVTSRGVMTTLNRVPLGSGYNPNSGFVAATPGFDRSADAAAKLFVNVLYLLADGPQVGAGSQKSSSSPIDVPAPLIERFKDMDEPLTPAGDAFVPPSIGFGLVAVTMSDTNHVHVYDANPSSDLDGDGDPDDGIRDYSLGAGVDKVWSGENYADPISPPILYEVPDATGPMRYQVAAVDATGRLLVWPAFPDADSDGVIDDPNAAAATIIDPPGGPGVTNLGYPGRGPYAPTFHEGLVYVADVQDAGTPVGRVWVADPATLDSVRTGTLPGVGWSVGGVGTTAIPEPSGSPTIGYIAPQDNPGGLDRVMYLPTRPSAVFAGPNASAGITSLWLGVRGERPTAVTESGGFLVVATRASSQGLSVYLPQGAPEKDGLGIKLTVIKSNGEPMTIAEMDTYFTGTVSESSGVLTFALTGTPLPASYSLRLDYSIDWGTGIATQSAQINRGQLFFPDDSNRERRILGNLALSAKGTLQVVTSSGDGSGASPGGSLWSISEQGKGVFHILNRWDLFNEHRIALNQTDPVTYRETLVNIDPLTTLIPTFAGTMEQLTFTGGPAVRDGVVYVVAQGYKPGFPAIPYQTLLAFDADPEAREVVTADLEPGFTLLQPDMARSSTKTAPESFSTLQPNQFVYERDPGTGTGRIRINTLSASVRGPIVNSLSTSQPLILRRPGQPDILFEPNEVGSRWNSLLYYTVLSGGAGSSAPVVTGNTVYVASSTILLPPATGMLVALEANISPTDPNLSSDPDRPWQKQLNLIKGGGFPVEANPSLLWPQLSGVENLTDFESRVRQATLGTSATSLGVAAGDGVVMGWSDQGLYGFARADVYVADEGRVARFDSVGNPIWAVSHTGVTGGDADVGGSEAKRPLVKPTRVYPINEREVLVVDAGANRVLRMDASGREIRSIERMVVDPTFKPDGYQSGEPLTLKAPRDAVYYTSRVALAQNPFSNAQPDEFWRHYIIADSKNYRVIELVDRYAYDAGTGRLGDVVPDLNGVPGLGVLYWHSPSTLAGDQYEFSSLARLYVSTGTPRYVVAAGIGNAMPTAAGIGLATPTSANDRNAATGNGGVVVFDGADSQVVNEITVPSFTTELWDGVGWTSASANSRTKTLGALQSVSMRNALGPGNTPVIAIMVSDASGVYEFYLGGANDVVWMLPRTVSATVGPTLDQFRVYTRMRRDLSDTPTLQNPTDFLPTYAKRLDNGDVLIVNGYVGTYPRAADVDPWRTFRGEVVQVDGSTFALTARNFGFGPNSLRYALPPISGARSLVVPVFADRR